MVIFYIHFAKRRKQDWIGLGKGQEQQQKHPLDLEDSLLTRALKMKKIFLLCEFGCKKVARVAILQANWIEKELKKDEASISIHSKKSIKYIKNSVKYQLFFFPILPIALRFSLYMCNKTRKKCELATGVGSDKSYKKNFSYAKCYPIGKAPLLIFSEAASRGRTCSRMWARAITKAFSLCFTLGFMALPKSTVTVVEVELPVPPGKMR